MVCSNAVKDEYYLGCRTKFLIIKATAHLSFSYRKPVYTFFSKFHLINISLNL